MPTKKPAARMAKNVVVIRSSIRCRLFRARQPVSEARAARRPAAQRGGPRTRKPPPDPDDRGRRRPARDRRAAVTFAVRTNRTYSGPSGCGSRWRQVEVAGCAQGDQNVVEGVLDGAAGRVDADVGVLRLLVGRGDAGELGDLAGARLGVETLAVAPLALLEGVATWTRKNAPPASSTIARTCWRVSSNGAMGLTTATPPCRAISAATQPIRRMLVSRSSLENVRPADRCRRTTSPSRLVTVRRPCSSSRSTRARASVDLPLPDRPVKKSTRPCSSGSGRSRVDDVADRRGVLAGIVLGERVDRVACDVRRDDLDAQLRGRPPGRRGRPAGR